jgi:glycosyltransferase 2 family protein
MTRHLMKPRAALWVLAWLAGLAVAVHLLLPQLGELGQTLDRFREGRWPWTLAATVASAATYLAGGLGIIVAAGVRLPLVGATMAQLAAGAASVLTPEGLGAVAVGGRWLEKKGIDPPRATATLTASMVVALVTHIGLMIVLAALVRSLVLPKIEPGTVLVVAEVVAAALVVAGIVLWLVPGFRRKVLAEALPMLRSIPAVFSQPGRAAGMIGAAVLVNVLYMAALLASLAAFGGRAPIAGVAFAYLTAVVVGTISPTPGGLGAFEAALAAGLTRLGVDAGTAIATSLSFRLVTFWLPLPIGAWAWETLRRRGDL